MGYGLLEVSQVGPPEYPLIAVLHEAVFGHAQAIAALRENPTDLLTLLAHLEGNPVGYLVGFGGAGGVEFVVDSLAVLPDYRRQKLATRMLDWAERHARSRGYRALSLSVPEPVPADVAGLAKAQSLRPGRPGVLTRPLPARQGSR